MKKSYKVLLIIISVLLLFGLVTGYKYLYYNTDTNNNNVYIYGDWDNDISILKNEDIIIQVPIYDFNQEIDDNTSISIQNFDDGEIYKTGDKVLVSGANRDILTITDILAPDECSICPTAEVIC